MIFAVAPIMSDGSWGDANYVFWEDNSARTSIDLGKDAASEPSKLPLENGTYAVQVTYNESKTMNPLRLMRVSKVFRKIQIKR